jgi:peptidoglycan hydrolase CwlO-like protein
MKAEYDINEIAKSLLDFQSQIHDRLGSQSREVQTSLSRLENKIDKLQDKVHVVDKHATAVSVRVAVLMATISLICGGAGSAVVQGWLGR